MYPYIILDMITLHHTPTLSVCGFANTKACSQLTHRSPGPERDPQPENLILQALSPEPYSSYIYIHPYIYIYIHIHRYIYVYIHTCTYTYTCLHMYMRIYIYTYMYVHLYIYICIYIRETASSRGVLSLPVQTSGGRPWRQPCDPGLPCKTFKASGCRV